MVDSVLGDLFYNLDGLGAFGGVQALVIVHILLVAFTKFVQLQSVCVLVLINHACSDCNLFRCQTLQSKDSCH